LLKFKENEYLAGIQKLFDIFLLNSRITPHAQLISQGKEYMDILSSDYLPQVAAVSV
jgi:hypothetical protein